MLHKRVSYKKRKMRTSKKVVFAFPHFLIHHRCSATDVLPPLTSSSTTDVQQQMFCRPPLPHPPQMFSNRCFASPHFLIHHRCSATDVLPPLTSSSTTDVQQQSFKKIFSSKKKRGRKKKLKKKESMRREV